MAEHKLYFSFNWDERLDRGYIGVISMGSFQLGDKNVEVLSVELLPTEEEIKAWASRMLEEQPWKTRS